MVPAPMSVPSMTSGDRAERPPVLLPLIIAFALFMENLDSTVVATALPAMARSLHESPLTLNVAMTSYLLSLAIFIPASGWLADRHGARDVFAGAIAVFTVSSLACGLAQNLPEMIVARIFQGLGGAMMTPVGRLVLLRSVSKAQLVQAMSYVTMPALVGPAIGPLVGGFIATYSSWRWIFLINLPIGLAGTRTAFRSALRSNDPSTERCDRRHEFHADLHDSFRPRLVSRGRNRIPRRFAARLQRRRGQLDHYARTCGLCRAHGRHFTQNRCARFLVW